MKPSLLDELNEPYNRNPLIHGGFFIDVPDLQIKIDGSRLIINKNIFSKTREIHPKIAFFTLLFINIPLLFIVFFTWSESGDNFLPLLILFLSTSFSSIVLVGTFFPLKKNNHFVFDLEHNVYFAGKIRWGREAVKSFSGKISDITALQILEKKGTNRSKNNYLSKGFELNIILAGGDRKNVMSFGDPVEIIISANRLGRFIGVPIVRHYIMPNKEIDFFENKINKNPIDSITSRQFVNPYGNSRRVPPRFDEVKSKFKIIVPINEMEAFQVLEGTVELPSKVPRYKEVCTLFELNVVMENGNRLNLAVYNNAEEIYDMARHLKEFFVLPYEIFFHDELKHIIMK